jgi:predicted RNase H-like nuclease
MPGAVGIHLLQTLAQIGTPRPSVVARVDGEGRVTALDAADDDAAIAALVEDGDDLVVVDAPLEVPAGGGRRDAEAVLAWCDVNAFPVSAERLEKVHGGARGPALAARLARPGRTLIETLPDAVLRQLAWEREHPLGTPPLPLADYRVAWLGVRAPAYRPKGIGRARPAGLAPAARLLAEVLELGGWWPVAEGDDWALIAEAARLDALACAYAGLRLRDPAASVVVGAPGRGRIGLPAGADLRERAEATVARLRAEGAVTI